MKGEVHLEPPHIERTSDSDPLLPNRLDSSSSSPSSSSPEAASSSEIQHDDIESGSVPSCRICLESDCEPGDELISPCKCKGTQQFVHRSCLDHWRSVKLIASMGGIAYLMDKDGKFRNSFSDGWDRMLSKHPILFYYCIGVLAFFVLLGFFGLILHCSSLNSNDPRMVGCQNGCYGWEILDCFPASMEACFALVVVFVVIFAILGIAYGFLAATMAIQKIWQKHYHILAKRAYKRVLAFFVLLGFFGLILHCSSLNSNDPRMVGCQNGCYGWEILDCFPASMEACFALVVVFVVIFAILGIAYGFLAATMAIQKIWQKHYHILAKRAYKRICSGGSPRVLHSPEIGSRTRRTSENA